MGIIGHAFSPARDRLPFLRPIPAMSVAQDLPHGTKLLHGDDVLPLPQYSLFYRRL